MKKQQNQNFDGGYKTTNPTAQARIKRCLVASRNFFGFKKGAWGKFSKTEKVTKTRKATKDKGGKTSKAAPQALVF